MISLRNRTDKHWDPVCVGDVVVSESRVSSGRRWVDRFVEWNRRDPCEMLTRERRDLLDRSERRPEQMHKLYDLWHIQDRPRPLHLNNQGEFEDLISSFSLTDRIDMIHVIDEIAFSQVTCDLDTEREREEGLLILSTLSYLGIRTAFLEDSAKKKGLSRSLICVNCFTVSWDVRCSSRLNMMDRQVIILRTCHSRSRHWD